MVDFSAEVTPTLFGQQLNDAISAAISTAVSTAVSTAISNAVSTTSALGVLPAGTTIANTIQATATGDPGGTSSLRVLLCGLTYSGAYGTTDQINALNSQSNFNHTAGTITFAYGVQSYNSLGGAGAVGIPTGNITTSRVFEAHTANKSSNGGAITDATNFFSGDVDLTRSGATGTIGTMRSFYSGDQGHATKVTVAVIGYDQNDMTGGAPLVAAFRHQMGSGTGKWGFYGAGSANNAYGGSSSFGKNTAPAEVVDVAGNVVVTGIYKVAGVQVVGPRQTGIAANATDLASVITLANDIRAKLTAHGLVS